MSVKPIIAQKCWEISGPGLVWQVDLRRQRGSKEKSFIVLDSRQGREFVRLAGEKPDGLKADGAIVNQIKKHLGRVHALLSWTEDELAGTETLVLVQKESSEPCFLVRSHSESCVSLVVPGKVDVVRFGSHGIFTKKKDYQGELPSAASWESPNKILQLLVDQTAPASSPVLDSEELDPRAALANDSEISAMLPEDQRQASQRLARRLRTLRKALAKIESQLPSAADVAQAERDSRLLQSYGHLVKTGSHALLLSPEQSGEDVVEIELDSDLTIGANIQAKFDRVKKLRRSLQIGEQRRQAAVKQLSDLEELYSRAKSSAMAPEILEREQRLAGLKSAQRPVHRRVADRLPYRIFAGEGGISILVGKRAEDNDTLTKQAQSQDDWLHVSGIPGSHVVIPHAGAKTRQLSDQERQNLLRQAAILAVHFSKLRKNLAGEVHVAKRADLRKRKGMRAGQWLVERASSIFVRYQPDELQSLLATYVEEGD